MTAKKIKVLIVDDSLLFREFLIKNLSADDGLEIVGAASDPFDARDKIIHYEPDVMTLDIAMPRMDGIAFLERLMPQYPIPTIVVSADIKDTDKAAAAGAVDYSVKPQAGSRMGYQSFLNELIIKIKLASMADMGGWKKKRSPEEGGIKKGYQLIAIGASTGGPEAVAAIIKEFPREMPGIVIVQHMPPVFTRLYAERLHHSSMLEVKEAENGDRIYPGRVLVAPGGKQMIVKKSGNGCQVECFEGAKVNGHCPSVDVLFASVAQEIGQKSIGIILTGMGRDGAAGLRSMREKGARTIGQDEGSCVVYGMPKAAFEMGAVEKQAALDRIPPLILSMIEK